MNLTLLERCEQKACLALDTMHRLVVDELPVGTEVEYQHGDHWIGPCKIIRHRYSGERYGPQIIVRNLKTGKERAICSYNFVRPMAGGVR